MVGDCVSLPACILCGVRVCVCCVLEMCHRNQSMGHGSDHDPSTPLVIDKNPVLLDRAMVTIGMDPSIEWD
jgi:hypothetical protein